MVTYFDFKRSMTNKNRLEVNSRTHTNNAKLNTVREKYTVLICHILFHQS